MLVLCFYRVYIAVQSLAHASFQGVFAMRLLDVDNTNDCNVVVTFRECSNRVQYHSNSRFLFFCLVLEFNLKKIRGAVICGVVLAETFRGECSASDNLKFGFKII